MQDILFQGHIACFMYDHCSYFADILQIYSFFLLAKYMIRSSSHRLIGMACFISICVGGFSLCPPVGRTCEYNFLMYPSGMISFLLTGCQGKL